MSTSQSDPNYDPSVLEALSLSSSSSSSSGTLSQAGNPKGERPPFMSSDIIGTEARGTIFRQNFVLFWQRMFTRGLQALDIYTVNSLVCLMLARLRFRTISERPLVWTMRQWLNHERADIRQIESFEKLLSLAHEDYCDEAQNFVQQAYDVYQSVRWMSKSLAIDLEELLVTERRNAFILWSDSTLGGHLVPSECSELPTVQSLLDQQAAVDPTDIASRSRLSHCGLQYSCNQDTGGRAYTIVTCPDDSSFSQSSFLSIGRRRSL